MITESRIRAKFSIRFVVGGESAEVDSEEVDICDFISMI